MRWLILAFKPIDIARDRVQIRRNFTHTALLIPKQDEHGDECNQLKPLKYFHGHLLSFLGRSIREMNGNGKCLLAPDVRLTRDSPVGK
jgi:hypothetical protein